MKKLILTSTLSLTCLLTNICLADNPKPEKCPGVSAIQAVGLHSATELRGGGYGVEAGADYQYDTTNKWMFTIIIPRTDRAHAFELANQALHSLRFVAGPHPGGRYGLTWECDYTNDSGYRAGTVKRS